MKFREYLNFGLKLFLIPSPYQNNHNVKYPGGRFKAVHPTPFWIQDANKCKIKYENGFAENCQ